MLPQFKDQNPPVTPNNGNPNTVYNSKNVPVLGQEVAVRDYEYLGAPVPQIASAATPAPAQYTPEPVRQPEPQQLQVAQAVQAPTFATPQAPEPQPVTQPSPPSIAPTTMGAWLPRFAIDTSHIGTQFSRASSPTMDYWRSRLEQIRNTPATPAPVTPPAPVTQPAPVVQPVTQPVQSSGSGFMLDGGSAWIDFLPEFRYMDRLGVPTNLR